ncbi:MAG TPA: RsiV family protein [Bordetella sp.]
MRISRYAYGLLWAGLASSAGVLAGCGSTPSDNISLAGTPTPAPAAPTATAASPGTPLQTGDVRTVPVRSEQSRPGCRGEDCPEIKIVSVAFPDMPGLTAAVDHGLAGMTWVDENLRGSYQDLSGYIAYFWRTARSGERTWLQASLRGVVGDVLSVELGTSQQLAGAAHSIPATRFLLWRRSTGKEIGLDDVLVAGRHAQFVAALRLAHGQWLQAKPGYREDPKGYAKLWPFVESDNVALTPQGLVVKYDAYTIAPYSDGEPEIVLPWDTVRAFVRPEFLPG